MLKSNASVRCFTNFPNLSSFFCSFDFLKRNQDTNTIASINTKSGPSELGTIGFHSIGLGSIPSITGSRTGSITSGSITSGSITSGSISSGS